MEMWYGTNSIHMWTMPILGSALLSLYVFLTVREQDTVALEILGTIKSFSIWEAADCFLVERLSIRKQMRYVSQNLVQEIELHTETDLSQWGSNTYAYCMKHRPDWTQPQLHKLPEQEGQGHRSKCRANWRKLVLWNLSHDILYSDVRKTDNLTGQKRTRRKNDEGQKLSESDGTKVIKAN